MLRLFSRSPGRSSSSQQESHYPPDSDRSLSHRLVKRRVENGHHQSSGGRTHPESSTAQLTSRTLAIASASLESVASPHNQLSLVPKARLTQSSFNSNSQNTRREQRVYYRAHSQPVYQSTSTSPRMTPQEMYWASRAIHSETLLAATTHYHSEVKELMRSKTDEFAFNKKEHDARREKLGWLLVLLVTAVMLLSAYAFYITITPRHKSQGWINFSFPNHITIPILSPFASVVETESSIFNTRAMIFGLIIVGLLGYGLIRHWINMTYKTAKAR